MSLLRNVTDRVPETRSSDGVLGRLDVNVIMIVILCIHFQSQNAQMQGIYDVKMIKDAIIHTEA